MIRSNERKLMPFLIQDFGIYCGNGIERSFPRNENKKITNKETTSNGKQLVLEYIKLTQEIEKLENKKTILIKQIQSNPELQKLFQELLNENSNRKTK